MKYGIYSVSEWVYPDEELTENKTITLNAARNSRCGFQLKLTGLTPDSDIRISHPFGSPLTMEAFRLVDVNVNQNTGDFGFTCKAEDAAPDYVTRRAPFRVYDPIRPYREGAERTSEKPADAFYFSFFVPAETVPGAYEESLTVAVGGESVTVTVTVKVWSAEVPSTETLDVTNWFSVGNMATRHHLTPWSEEHWDMIRRYGALMRRSRQTCFWITRDLIQTAETNGHYSFDFSRAKRLIEMYLDMGFSVIEGSPLAGRHGWGAANFFISDGTKEMPATSLEGYAYLAQYLTAWKDFLEENGWYDLLIQHVADEPHDACKDEYFRLSSIVRQHLPGVPIIEAVEMADLYGAVDIWVPKDNDYTNHTEQFEACRAAGNTIWFYTCCIPGGHFLNRLLDKPLVEVRYLHWSNFKFRMPGYLHWGLNHCGGAQDPFECTSPAHTSESSLPAGDSHVLYPAEEGPLGSMRLENHCFGAQDYELFSLLADRNEALARTLADGMIKAFNDVNYDVDAMEKTRIRLLEELA